MSTLCIPRLWKIISAFNCLHMECRILQWAESIITGISSAVESEGECSKDDPDNEVGNALAYAWMREENKEFYEVRNAVDWSTTHPPSLKIQHLDILAAIIENGVLPPHNNDLNTLPDNASTTAATTGTQMSSTDDTDITPVNPPPLLSHPMLLLLILTFIEIAHELLWQHWRKPLEERQGIWQIWREIQCLDAGHCMA